MRNFTFNVLTMPDLRFRLMAGLLTAPFLLYTTFFGAPANITALLFALITLILFAPKVRSKALSLPQSQAFAATFFLVISLGLMSYFPITLSWFGLNAVYPFLGCLRMYTLPMPRMSRIPKEALLSQLAVADKPKKAPRDPGKPLTNTRKRELARQARKKK